MTQEPTRQFSEYVRRLREGRKLSVRSLAAKASISGGELSRIENGKRMPQADTLKTLAAALDVPLADMFAMADYVIPYDLPSITPYLHARYGHLPPDTLTSIDNYLKQLIDEHGMDPNGPHDFEDETSTSSQR
jgi:transcriptional regulator with XRE-family HTH domain